MSLARGIEEIEEFCGAAEVIVAISYVVEVKRKAVMSCAPILYQHML